MEILKGTLFIASSNEHFKIRKILLTLEWTGKTIKTAKNKIMMRVDILQYNKKVFNLRKNETLSGSYTWKGRNNSLPVLLIKTFFTCFVF